MREGVDIRTVSEVTGTNPQTLLKYYIGPDEDLSRDAVMRATQYFRGGFQLSLVDIR